MSQSFTYSSGLSVRPSSACDRVLEFQGDDVPPEIQALGPPERVHRPSPLLCTLVSCRYLFYLLFLAGIGTGFVLIYQEMKLKNQLDQLTDPWVLAGAGLLGALALGGAVAMTRIPVTRATVFFYPRAAVVAEGNKLTLIPWKHLLVFPDRICTSEGHEFYCRWLERHDAFEERIWELSAEHWVPDAVARIKAGETVTAGDLAFSSTHISYQGKTAAWDEVTHVVINIINQFYTMVIRTSASAWINWASVDMHKVPNCRAVEQLLTHICPSHLLKPAE